jgi:hypothetical protein
MTHAEIAANARKPYADAIARFNAQHDALVNAVRVILREFDCGRTPLARDITELRRHCAPLR